MKNKLPLLLILFSLLNANSQTAVEITKLQTTGLDETSGLLFYNNQLITHNDSGGKAHLYEIDTNTGAIIRTVEISNATNIDWEDITQDDTYIYIGDIGNNYGSRTDLKIYRILKEDYKNAANKITAEVISYSYANQTDFTANLNNNNWDAEGLISYHDKLLIFSKNWKDNTVDVYSVPKIIGTHSAVLESSYNTNGLITAAETSFDKKTIYLTGYSQSEAPFLFKISNIPSNSLDIFSGSVSEKITKIVPAGNQIEALAVFKTSPTEKDNLYISNEKSIVSFGTKTFPFPSKLWSLELHKSTLNTFDISSNPSLTIRFSEKKILFTKKVDQIMIYDLSGKIIKKEINIKKIDLNYIKEGIYIICIVNNNTKIFKKLLLN